MRLKTIIALLFINFILCSNFLINDSSASSSTNISFHIGEYSISDKGNYKEILTTSEGRLVKYGEPD